MTLAIRIELIECHSKDNTTCYYVQLLSMEISVSFCTLYVNNSRLAMYSSIANAVGEHKPSPDAAKMFITDEVYLIQGSRFSVLLI